MGLWQSGSTTAPPARRRARMSKQRKKQSRFGVWFDKAAAWDVADLFARKKGPGLPRTVFVNEPLPPDYFDQKGRVKKEHVYPTNQVITSKYTIITFVPRNLLEQFRRIANIFFLGIAILQFFSIFSTISPGLVILPLLVVLAITALKDGYEDVKRHQSDARVNGSPARVLAGGEWENHNRTAGKARKYTEIPLPRWRWGRLRRGNKAQEGGETAGTNASAGGGLLAGAGAAVELSEKAAEARAGAQSPSSHIEFDDDDDDYGEAGDETPGSHGLFHRADAHTRPHWRRTPWEDVHVGDVVQIRDGEPVPADVLLCATSEDENVAYVETKNLDGETNLKSRHAVPQLARFRSARAIAAAAASARFRIELDRPDTSMFKLPGTVVLFSPEGEEEERAPVDMQMTLLRGTVLRNTRWVIGVVLYTGDDTKIVMNSGGTPSKRSRVERQMNPQVIINLLILATMAVVLAIIDHVLEQREYPENAPWLYADNRSDNNPSVNGVITFAFALITFQNIVPISLYISIEVVRTCQAIFIYFDHEMYYAKTDQATLARSWNLSDDLGQIEYVFSDKTGTLTQNSMVFRQCSVGGRRYKGEESEEAPLEKTPDSSAQVLKTTYDGGVDVRLSESAGSSSSTPMHPDPAAPGAAQHLGREVVPDVKTALPPIGRTSRFRDAGLVDDLADAVSASPDDPAASAHARALNGFFSVLALCHTVLASADARTGRVEYKAQSPDEAALVQAAADAGFVFRGREREVLFLQTPFGERGGAALERYELLNILDFTSARKRMSVLVRQLGAEGEPDGRVFLLCKGADNVIFERLKPGTQDELKDVTERHLDEFASEGLRTLTLAYKVVPEDEYTAWAERYHAASVSLDDRDARVDAVSAEIERDLRLLGATAIEDKLQDGVPQTIADLKTAGIKVWVLTGDKLETAVAIGHSTNLIAPDSNMIVIRGSTSDRRGRPVYQQMLYAMEEFFPEEHILDDPAVMAAGPALQPEQDYSPAPSGDARPDALRRVNTGVSSLVGQDNGARPGGFVLVIDGAALTDAFADEANKELLLRLGTLCEAVVCCRVSPLQKALVVRLVKEGLTAMTLAIGDGANDVSMIQAADVGVGISGEEGLQAVNSSDYAIAQFRFLKRLLLVHGHWSYARNGNMILNFFYKNIICIGVLWWFQIYCAWSSAYAFEYTYLIFWNGIWTVLPVIAIGIFDQIVSDDVLMAFPELYKYGREGYWFGTKLFLYFMSDGVVQAAIIFFIVNYSYFSPTSRTDGYDVAQYEWTTAALFAAVFAANGFNGLNTNVWTWWVVFALAFGVVILWLFTVVYDSISPGWFPTDVFGNDHYLFHSAIFWFTVLLTTILSLLPRYVVLAYKFGFIPDDIDTFRYIKKHQPQRDLMDEALRLRDVAAVRRLARMSSRSTMQPSTPSRYSPGVSRAPSRADVDSLGDVSLDVRQTPDVRAGSRTDMSTGERSTHGRGFDFVTEENGVAMRRIQTNLSERHSSRSVPLAQQQHRRGLFSLRRKKPPTPKGSQ